ncbi:MAG: YicC/YloC family endoribonuclease [Longimicrobiales bacterium]
MIRSMTGYGEGERALPTGRLRVTIKTVNHRFFNAHIRTPLGFDRFEADIQSWLRSVFSRGHVNFTLTLERERPGGDEGYPEVDLDRARHYRGLLEALKEALDLPGEIELSAFLRFNELFRAPDPSGQEPVVEESVLKEVTDEAAGAALVMREKEGARLESDLLDRLRRMEEELARVEALAPGRLVAERDRLREAIRELSQQAEVDEDRLAKEVAYMADRWDINEEIVRFRAHLHAFRDTLASDSREPVGKRLGFLVQEMHREANTIGSKANDLEIGHASVAIREEIERLREQLENVE